MSESEELLGMEQELDRSIRRSIRGALSWIEQLPEDTSLQRMKKTAAYVELLTFILNFSELLGSMQSAVLDSLRKRKGLQEQPYLREHLH